MKYIYKILRLFKCPHRYKFVNSEDISVETKLVLGKRIIGKVHTLQCNYCGDVKFKEHRL